jgi:hypothetical protein
MPQGNAKEYVERGRFEQPERSNAPAWSYPAVANGKLYMRDQGEVTKPVRRTVPRKSLPWLP